MSKFRDVVRFLIISPELVFSLIPFLLLTYWPSGFDALLKPMRDGIGFGLGAAVFPLGMLAFNYKEGFDLLAPVGGKKILLEWPDYFKLKARVIATFCWCVFGAVEVLVAVVMVNVETYPRISIAIVVSGIVTSAVSTATLCLARFTIREIIGE